MTADDEARLQLLLLEDDEYIPALADGLDERVLAGAPRPDGDGGPGKASLEAPGDDPDDLPAQRWGIIAPAGDAGDRMLAAIEALVEHRRAQQGAAPTIYRVPPAMNVAAAIRWRDAVHRAEDTPEDERPRYLLVLGDLHEISLELQHVLAAGALVGRLQCPDLAGFRAYAEKVVAAERGQLAAAARALYYTAEDDTPAVELGYDQLVAPCLRYTREWAQTGRLAVDDVTELSEGSADELLRAAEAAAPALMLSLSHGLGAPRRGWRSPEEQRARQGTLFLGVDELGAAELRASTFLPGGVWLCVACFSAGTPATSAFYPWLAALAGRDRGAAAEVLRSLPPSGERPFVAALPQAALANPRGPLAVIGHVDLAWTFGFGDPDGAGSRASRIFSALRVLLAGGRAGVALDALMRTYRDTNDDLMSRYHRQRDAAARDLPDPEDPRQLGRLWLQRNDLRGYVLLGDPAARLAVAPQKSANRDDPRRAIGAARTRDALEVRQPAPAQPNPRAPDPTSRAAAYPAPDPRISDSPPSLAHAGPIPRSPGASATPRPRSADTPTTTSQRGPIPRDGDMPPATPHRGPLPRTTDTQPATAQSALDPPTRDSRPATAQPGPRAPAFDARERAVLALLHGDEAPRAIADRCGVTVAELFLWLDRYRDAGRRALSD